MQLPEREVHALMRAEHGDPFAVLGPHETVSYTHLTLPTILRV